MVTVIEEILFIDASRARLRERLTIFRIPERFTCNQAVPAAAQVCTVVRPPPPRPLPSLWRSCFPAAPTLRRPRRKPLLPPRPPPRSAPDVDALGDNIDYFDSRDDASTGKTLADRSARLSARPSAGVKALRKALGTQGLLDIDPLTRTPRTVARLDGFLTGPSPDTASKVTLRYVTAHRQAFGLSSADVKGLHLRKEYVDIEGTTTSVSCSRSEACPCSATA
ncbi:hypothetical protein ACQP2F_15300 [Actinoplanes sp. CA-030573]|uniref:hypothetical protein n=1 Tax=Actinoplanes sp. CA-030573 TaxID=3239898 RepID=UPI003D903249